MPRDVIPADLEAADQVAAEGLTASMHRLEGLIAEMHRADSDRSVSFDDGFAKSQAVFDRLRKAQQAVMEAEPTSFDEATGLLMLAYSELTMMRDAPLEEWHERVDQADVTGRAVLSALLFLLKGDTSGLPGAHYFIPRGANGEGTA